MERPLSKIVFRVNIKLQTSNRTTAEGVFCIIKHLKEGRDRTKKEEMTKRDNDQNRK